VHLKQDHASIHDARVVDWMGLLEFDRAQEFPPNSPELNLIENVRFNGPGFGEAKY
jgi:hypothetical protein